MHSQIPRPLVLVGENTPKSQDNSHCAGTVTRRQGKYPRTPKVLASTCQGVLGGLFSILGVVYFSLIDTVYGLRAFAVLPFYIQV